MLTPHLQSANTLATGHLTHPGGTGDAPAWSRRQVLTLAGAAAAGLALHAAPGFGSLRAQPAAAPEGGPAIAKADKSLSILVLGGTIFLGPHIVEHLRARGHSITLFNRGKSNPTIFPELESLRGDRLGDLSVLQREVDKGRKWDCVLDTSAYVPLHTRRAAEMLKPAIGGYVLVSTVNVYRDDDTPDQDESGPTHEQWPDDAPISNEQYGPMKRGCEVELLKILPDAAVVRPSLIAGPRDVTDRFSYWPIRATLSGKDDRGSEILAPVGPEALTQVVDARDLAAFMVHLAETRQGGTFNTLGLRGLTMGQVLKASIASATRAGAAPSTIRWVAWDELAANDVSMWQDLPAFIPDVPGAPRGMLRRIGTRAEAAGFKARPIAETCRDIQVWWGTLPEKRRARLRAGLSAEKERQVLAAISKTSPPIAPTAPGTSAPNATPGTR
jgi:2'-hydroxyisoflavone reductase